MALLFAEEQDSVKVDVVLLQLLAVCLSLGEANHDEALDRVRSLAIFLEGGEESLNRKVLNNDFLFGVLKT